MVHSGASEEKPEPDNPEFHKSYSQKFYYDYMFINRVGVFGGTHSHNSVVFLTVLQKPFIMVSVYRGKMNHRLTYIILLGVALVLPTLVLFILPVPLFIQGQFIFLLTLGILKILLPRQILQPSSSRAPPINQ